MLIVCHSRFSGTHETASPSSLCMCKCLHGALPVFSQRLLQVRPSSRRCNWVQGALASSHSRKGRSNVETTAWQLSWPSQPAEPLGMSQFLASRVGPACTQCISLFSSKKYMAKAGRKAYSDWEEAKKKNRYRMVLGVAVSTLHVGGSDVWITSLLKWDNSSFRQHPGQPNLTIHLTKRKLFKIQDTQGSWRRRHPSWSVPTWRWPPGEDHQSVPCVLGEGRVTRWSLKCCDCSLIKEQGREIRLFQIQGN